MAYRVSGRAPVFRDGVGWFDRTPFHRKSFGFWTGKVGAQLWRYVNPAVGREVLDFANPFGPTTSEGAWIVGGEADCPRSRESRCREERRL
jgi:hypothetical protein